MPGVKNVDLAAYFGMTENTIWRLRKRGMPGDSCESARDWYVKNIPNKGRSKVLTFSPPPPASKPAPTPNDSAGTPYFPPDTYDIQHSRAKQAHHEANLAELKELQARGEVVSAADVLAQWQNIVANVRARLLALPSKLAAQGFAARSRGELQKLLTEGVNEALAELAGGRRDD